MIDNEMKIHKALLMGALHMLVAFTSIVVVTKILDFNLPVSFLFAGINTILFHIVTKNKLPVVMGVSGLYIGSILYVTQTFGKAYAYGGIIVAGCVYIVFALLMFLWQDKILKYFPDWLLSIVVLLIGLNLLPIGVGLMKTSMLVGLVSFGVVAIIDLFGGKKLSMFSMLMGVIAGTFTMAITKGIDFSLMKESMAMEFIKPQFNLSASLTIGLIAIAVLFEMMGDVKNTSDIIGINVFEEVGLGRISLGNGLATIIGGFGSANAFTTYSESTAFVMLTKYYNPMAQIFTGLFFIIVAFCTPISKFIMCLPIEAFGGAVTYLFAMIVVNSIKQFMNSGINLNSNKKVFVIITVMVAISLLPFVVSGISISSVAVATLVGTILNIMIPD